MKTLVNFSTHRELLLLVGGYQAVSEALTQVLQERVPYSTVASWTVFGIPVRVWPAIIAMAADRDVAVTAEQLLLTRPMRAKTERRARRGRTSRSESAAAGGA